MSWSEKAPKGRPQRRRKANRCGAARCFLVPGRLLYPVCPMGSCKPSCEGLEAARSRAITQRHKAVMGKAERLLRRRCK